MKVFFFITHIRQLTFLTKQTKSSAQREAKKGRQDYCELIKAKSQNFPSKKQPLPVTPSPNPATISRVEAQRERGKVKGGESVNVLKINPCSFFFQVPALSEQVAGGEREENWEGGAGL